KSVSRKRRSRRSYKKQLQCSVLFLEKSRGKLMALKQLVKLCAVALRQPRGLSNTAVSGFQEFYQIITLEILTGNFEGDDATDIILQCFLHECCGYQWRGG